MCGRMNVTDHPAMRTLMEGLGLSVCPDPRLNIAPGSLAQFVRQLENGERTLVEGYWSLLIEPKPDGEGYRPSPRYSTFNAQSRRLESSPLWRSAYRDKRCIVPVSGFHEWVGKQCYNITPADGGAIALAGLYRQYQFGSASIDAFTVITLPPQPAFSHIHSKSFPLMLLPDDFAAWLDPELRETGTFADLMAAGIRLPVRATPVLSPAKLEPTGPAQEIAA